MDKSVAQSKEAESSPNAITTDELRAALEAVRKEDPPPKTVEAREQYFMSQVSLGEQLALQGKLKSLSVCLKTHILSLPGPAFYLPAALSFYRALRVYPSPADLIIIYQKTVPEPIFKVM